MRGESNLKRVSPTPIGNLSRRGFEKKISNEKCNFDHILSKEVVLIVIVQMGIKIGNLSSIRVNWDTEEES